MAKEKVKETESVAKEMTLEEAAAWRASLAKPEVITLSAEEKREKFRAYWAMNRTKYGQPKDVEEIIWVHLKAMKMDDPEKFEDGVNHFGLKKSK